MSTTAAAAPAAIRRSSASKVLSHRQILVILSGLMLGMFLAALDQSIVSTAIRTIADDLKGLDEQAWATTAYLITSTLSTPLYGKLSDMYGRKPFFLFAISIFIVGSIACTFATSMTELAAFRAVQGIGGGGLMSLAITIIADIVPARQRAKYQGYFLAVFATSSVLGPVLGGLLAGQASILGIDGWRWVFLVNVPIAAIALVVVAKVLNVPHVRKVGKQRIDWAGVSALILGLVPLLLVAEQGQTWGWASVGSFLCYGIGFVGLVAFFFIERHYGDDALIPLRLFRNRTFSVSAVGGLIVGIAMFGGIAIIPQFMQIVRGATPTESGLYMLPFVAGMMVFSIISGQLVSRTGRYKIFPLIGLPLLVASALLMYFRLSPEISFGELSVYMVLMGAGIGLCMQTINTAAQNAVPARDVGVATSTVTMTRSLGGTLGTAVFISMLFSTVGGNISKAFGSAARTLGFQSAVANPIGGAENHQVAAQIASGPKGIGALAGRVSQDSSFLQKIDPRLAHPFWQGFADSMTLILLCAAIVAALGWIIFWFMKEIPLRATSAAQAVAEEAAAAEAGVAPMVPVADTAVLEQALPQVPLDWEPERELVLAGVSGNGNNNGNSNSDGTVLASTTEFAPRSAGAHRAEQMSAAFVAPGQGVPVSGRVHRGGGEPVTGAVLTLIDTGGRQVSRTTAGGDGSYRLDAPGAGHYVLIASAGAHQPEASTIVVGTGPVECDVALAGTAGLGGVVTSVNSGEPIVGATATLADSRGEVVGAKHTGRTGEYVFGELVAGEYTLVVSANAFRPLALSVAVSGSGQTRQDVALAGGARLTGVARAGADEHPVGDARITLLDAEGHVVAVNDTAPDGSYGFTDLAAGEYTVIASGYPPVASTLRVGAETPDEHNVTLGHPEAGK